MALKGYGKYTPEAADREKEELDRVFGASIIKMKVGKNVVRILPPQEGRDTPFELIWMHFVDVQERTEVFPCPRRMAKRPCPVCAKAEQMRSSGDEAMYERARSLFAKRQWYANAIDRRNPGDGVQLVGWGKEIMDQVNTIRRNLVEDNVDFTDPYEGIDLVVERTGTTRDDTEYTVTTRGLKVTPLGEDDDQMQEWIDAMLDLAKKAIPPASEEIIMRLKAGNAESATNKAAGGGRERRQVGGGSNGKQRSLSETKRRTAEDDLEEDDAPLEGDVINESDVPSEGQDDEIVW